MSNGIFERIPDGWHIEVNGESCRTRDLIGFCYIDVLLRHPGRSLPNTQVVALVGGVRVFGNEKDRTLTSSALNQHFGNDVCDEDSDSGECSGFQVEELSENEIDDDLLRDTRRLLAQKKRQKQAAHVAGNLTQADALAKEIKETETFLSKGLRLGGRSRKLRNAGDRDRERVSAGVRRAIAHLAILNPLISDYFHRNIALGERAEYLDITTDWTFSKWHLATADVKVDLKIERDSVGRLVVTKSISVG